jgi:hypothetical protein
MIAAAGKIKVDTTIRLGDEINLRDEKKASRITMQEPAPRVAASKEAAMISFSRTNCFPVYRTFRSG